MPFNSWQSKRGGAAMGIAGTRTASDGIGSVGRSLGQDRAGVFLVALTATAVRHR